MNVGGGCPGAAACAAAAPAAPAPCAAPPAGGAQSEAFFPFARLPADVKLRVVALLAGCPAAASADGGGGDAGPAAWAAGSVSGVGSAAGALPEGRSPGEPRPSPWAEARYPRPSRAAAPAALVCREWRALARALVSELSLTAAGAARLSHHAGPGLAAFPGLRRLTLAPAVRDADARRVLMALPIPESRTSDGCGGGGGGSDGEHDAWGGGFGSGGGGGGRALQTEGLASAGAGVVELVGRGGRHFLATLSPAALLPALPAGLAGLTRLQLSAARADLYQPAARSPPWGRQGHGHSDGSGDEADGGGGGGGGGGGAFDRGFDPGRELAELLGQLPRLADLAVCPGPAHSGALRRAAPRLRALRALTLDTLPPEGGADGGPGGWWPLGELPLASPQLYCRTDAQDPRVRATPPAPQTSWCGGPVPRRWVRSSCALHRGGGPEAAACISQGSATDAALPCPPRAAPQLERLSVPFWWPGAVEGLARLTALRLTPSEPGEGAPHPDCCRGLGDLGQLRVLVPGAYPFDLLLRSGLRACTALTHLAVGPWASGGSGGGGVGGGGGAEDEEGAEEITAAALAALPRLESLVLPEPLGAPLPARLARLTALQAAVSPRAPAPPAAPAALRRLTLALAPAARGGGSAAPDFSALAGLGALRELELFWWRSYTPEGEAAPLLPSDFESLTQLTYLALETSAPPTLRLADALPARLRRLRALRLVLLGAELVEDEGEEGGGPMQVVGSPMAAGEVGAAMHAAAPAPCACGDAAFPKLRSLELRVGSGGTRVLRGGRAPLLGPALRSLVLRNDDPNDEAAVAVLLDAPSPPGAWAPGLTRLELRVLLRPHAWRAPAWLGALASPCVVRLPGLIGDMGAMSERLLGQLGAFEALARRGVSELQIDFNSRAVLDAIARGGSGRGGGGDWAGAEAAAAAAGTPPGAAAAAAAVRAFLRDWGHMLVTVER
jgi:hypothetical protein